MTREMDITRGPIALLVAALFCVLPAVVFAQSKPPPPPPGMPCAPPPADAVNLLPNGNFDQPNDKKDGPANWQGVDSLVWHWVIDPDAPERGKVMKIDTAVEEKQAYDWWIERYVKNAPLSEAPKKDPIAGVGYTSIAGLDGGFFWSDLIPIKPGAAYRVYVDMKGPPCKVMLRGYETERALAFADEEPGAEEALADARGEARIDANGRPIKHRLHFTYTKWFPTGGGDKWATYTSAEPCHPTSRELTKNVRFVRVMLYPYWPPDTYWFDNIRLIEVPGNPEVANPKAGEADYREGKVVRPADPGKGADNPPTTAPAK